MKEPFETFEEWLERSRATDERERPIREERRKREARAIRLCPLRSPLVRGLSGPECARRRICFLDGRELPKRRQRWCSDRCVETYYRNHAWSTASFWARARAKLDLVAAIGKILDWEELHRLGLVAIPSRCERCGRRGEVEINHVVPRAGEGYEEGCHHHQTNLEPLCHPCHVAETTAQIRERKGLGPRVSPAETLPLFAS